MWTKRTMLERVAFLFGSNFTTDCFHHGILLLVENTFVIKAKCDAAQLAILLVVANKKLVDHHLIVKIRSFHFLKRIAHMQIKANDIFLGFARR
jgi:hypothetical protein